MDCIFCKIIKREIPSKILAETKNSLAFLDAFPLTKGHSLVIPKNHYEKIHEIPSNENTDLFELVRTFSKKIDSITGATLVSIHNGKKSGQEIPHVHIHLIPRSKEDGAGPVHQMFKKQVTLTEEESSKLQNDLKVF